jgi:Tfp pilus assembly protein PilE
MNRKPGKKPTPRGFTLLEVIVSGALLGAVLIVSAHMVWSIARQREAILDRQTALSEAGNVMERLFARPWDDLSDEAVRGLRPSVDFQRALPGGKLSIELTSLTDDPAAKRILVKVSWIHEPDQPDRSVQLVALRYQVEPARDNGRTEEQGKLTK